MYSDTIVTTEATLCTIIKDDKILLQKKAEGRFGEGKWNSPGGKIRPDEPPEACVVREVYEETGIIVRSPRLHGVLKHYFGEKTEPDWIVYQFSATDFDGEPKEGDEGQLKWFLFDEIPYDQMWQDDEYWLPHLLDGKKFRGRFYFNEDATELLSHCINVEN